jgi:hypothetical protein
MRSVRATARNSRRPACAGYRAPAWRSLCAGPPEGPPHKFTHAESASAALRANPRAPAALLLVFPTGVMNGVGDKQMANARTSEIKDDANLGLAMLIAEFDGGDNQPVAGVVSINEARDIAASNMRVRTVPAYESVGVNNARLGAAWPKRLDGFLVRDPQPSSTSKWTVTRP